MDSMTLKQWRAVKGYTQEHMSERLGIHRNTYSDWENNPENISIHNSFRIAEILGVPNDKIIFCEETLRNEETK